MSLLQVDAVTVIRSGRTLLDDVSLRVNERQFVGLVGPNGAGKSTLLRVLAGDLRPDRGTAALDGIELTASSLQDLAKLRSYVGPLGVSDVVFRVGDVVAMGGHPLSSAGPRADRDRAVAAMAQVDVDHLADRVMRTLSSGEQQRVNLARAINQSTPLFLLDEPTSALDVGHQEMIMSVLAALAGGGAAVVAVLHDLNLAAAFADQVMLMDDGRVIASGPPRAVLTGPLLSAAYGEAMQVIDHPFRDCPLVLTTGG